MKRAQKIRLGIFITVSTGFLLILIGYFTAQRLFERKDQYFVAYSDISVSGLEVGSPVKYLGINVGSISSIAISAEDVNKVIVGISLQEGTPVKKDAVADIVAMGITGLKTIEIGGGTQDADFLEPGGFIRQGTSFADDISGKAEVIYFKLEQVLNNLQDFTAPGNMQVFSRTAEDISSFARQSGETVNRIDDVLAENREDLRQALEAINRFTGGLDKTSDELYLAISRFNEIMQGDTLSEVLGNFRDISLTLKETNLNDLITELATATQQTQALLLRIGDDVDRGSETITENLLLLQYTMQNIHDASRKISSNPSVLVRPLRIEDTPDRRLK